jgi:lysozyme
MIKTKSRYLGAALLAFAIGYTSSWEGRGYVAYQDVGGVWTICDGIIKGVKKADEATAFILRTLGLHHPRHARVL